MVLLSGIFLLRWTLSHLISLIQLVNTIIEFSFLHGFIVFAFAFSSIILCILLTFCLSWLWLLALAWLSDTSELTELGIADHAVGIVVASAENGLDVFSPWEETVPLKVENEVRHRHRMIPFGNCVKDAHFHKVLAQLELALSFLARTLKLHFFVEQAAEEGQNLVRNGCCCSKVR